MWTGKKGIRSDKQETSILLGSSGAFFRDTVGLGKTGNGVDFPHIKRCQFEFMKTFFWSETPVLKKLNSVCKSAANLSLK